MSTDAVARTIHDGQEVDAEVGAAAADEGVAVGDGGGDVAEFDEFVSYVDEVVAARQRPPDPAFAGLDDDGLEQQAAVVAVATCRWLELLAELVARGIWERQGARTPGQWLSWATGHAPSTAREHVRVALRLAAFPATHARFAAGELSYSKVRQIVSTGRPDLEPELLEYARYGTASQLERIVAGFRRSRRAEADAPPPDPYRIELMARDDQRSEIRIGLPTADAHGLVDHLDALVDQDRRTRTPDAPAQGAAGPGRSLAEERVVALLRAVVAATLRDPADAPTVAPEAATVIVHADADDLFDPPADAVTAAGDAGAGRDGVPAADEGGDAAAAGGSGAAVVSDVPDHDGDRDAAAAWADGHESDGSARGAGGDGAAAAGRSDAAGAANVSADDGDREAEAAGARAGGSDAAAAAAAGSGRGRHHVVASSDRPIGVTIGAAGRAATLSVRVLRQLACDARLAVAGHDADGDVSAVSGTTRRVPTRLRRLLALRDRHCRFPGCDRTRWLHAHHIVHWADGGPTEAANLVLLCGHHHRFVHARDWVVHHDGRGRFRFAPPDGAPVPPQAPPLAPALPLRVDLPPRRGSADLVDVHNAVPPRLQAHDGRPGDIGWAVQLLHLAIARERTPGDVTHAA